MTKSSGLYKEVLYSKEGKRKSVLVYGDTMCTNDLKNLINKQNGVKIQKNEFVIKNSKNVPSYLVDKFITSTFK